MKVHSEATVEFCMDENLFIGLNIGPFYRDLVKIGPFLRFSQNLISQKMERSDFQFSTFRFLKFKMLKFQIPPFFDQTTSKKKEKE